MRYLLILISAAFCATGLPGQNSATVSSGPSGFNGSATFPAPRFAVRAVTDAPYSAEEVSEQVQTLADGTHITHNFAPIKIYRDSLGRSRSERRLFRGMAMAASNPDAPVVVEITDPVALVKYTLDTVNKVAHRQQLPSMTDRANRVSARSQTPSAGATGGVGADVAGGGVQNSSSIGQVPATERPQHTTEKLGSQMIEGTLVEGTRNTTTFPIGSQGNDRPISTVNEVWMSPDLKVMIQYKSIDPQNGERTQKLTNISRAEPSADLFQPPQEYTVVDEAGEFTIKWGTQP
jgi:hypothetical protein